MPWKVKDRMSLIKEFLYQASLEGANIAELCRQFGISRKTAYKWLNRLDEQGMGALQEHSRRPLNSPKRMPDEIVSTVVALRRAHPCWGGRKLRARLLALGHSQVPASSTITDILRREGLLDPEECAKHKPWQRFEHEKPNLLWQMDFKGHFEIASGRCYPLTVLDDHSRFSICLAALGDERGETVKEALSRAFRTYGLPERMTMDNGTPWGTGDADHRFTAFTVWLMRLGVKVSHSRPFHPQTQGKDERFHRSLKAELIVRQEFQDLSHCQEYFDHWRTVYNTERPHEAIGLAVPASRYTPSSNPFPEKLPPIEYQVGDEVRRVHAEGRLQYNGHSYRIGKAFRGQILALRPSEEDGIVDVYFCQQRIAKLDLHQKIRIRV